MVDVFGVIFLSVYIGLWNYWILLNSFCCEINLSVLYILVHVHKLLYELMYNLCVASKLLNC